MGQARGLTRIRDPPGLPWVDPEQCLHPAPIILLRFTDSEETRFYCGACGTTMTRADLWKITHEPAKT
ncbi:hypothetical protein [[Eubacterium] cellulosolvens]